MKGQPPRLSLASLSDVDAAMRPGYDPAEVGVGIVHLGIGAFARAHVAHYTDRVIAGRGGDWGMLGVSQRTSTVPDTLRPQDGLYTLLERDGTGPSVARVIGSLREVACAKQAPQEIVDRIAASTTKIVTLTVTEKGYRYNPGSGRLLEDEGLAADLAGGAPGTVVGQIVRGLQQRHRAEGGPMAIVSCDNLPGNGPLLRGLVHEFLDRLDEPDTSALQSWVTEQIAFPQTMVDRIVPATVDGDRQEIERLLGLHDAAAVVTEPFTQWVIEDCFTGPRPAWEDAGATLTNDVGLYEVMKLRMLNGAHSLIAYLGLLAGYPDIAGTLQDPVIEAAVRDFLEQDAAPAVLAPPGVDLREYGEEVLSRFANPSLGHLTRQVGMDGSHKLPQRLLGTARSRLEQGQSPEWVALGVAAWIQHLGGVDDEGQPIHVNDPLEGTLRPLAVGDDPVQDVVQRVLGYEPVFGTDLVADDRFTGAVSGWLAPLREHGVKDTLAAGRA